jgi:hypothetical protein
MEWIEVEKKPIPKGMWVLAYCTHIVRYGEGQSEEDEDKRIKVVKLEGEGTDPHDWSTSNNTCGCCNYGLVVSHWMPRPISPH